MKFLMRRSRLIVQFLGILNILSLLAGCSSLGDYWRTDYTSYTSNYHTGSQNNNPMPPRKIALLLPLSGPMGAPGRAARDGFMAAYYQTLQSKEMNTKVSVYDTTNGNIETLYEQAIRDGADCIVGPLEKEKVQQIVRSPVPVTTLVLNYVDPVASYSPSSNLYQFGLSPLDEAKQAAQYAFSSGHHSAIIIAPGGAWGSGVTQAFKTEWLSLGGKTVAQFNYLPGQDMGPYIRQLLQVNDSAEYEAHMTKLLGRDLRTEEHRRQDADMIFLVAQPPKARQIVPLLAFYYAADLPVYSIASVYSGIPSPLYDQDLNGVIFDDMPWVYNSDAAKLSSFPKLYALGMDAFTIVYQRSQWQNAPDSSILGKTGVLYLTANHQIKRKQLVWGQFQQGEARLIE